MSRHRNSPASPTAKVVLLGSALAAVALGERARAEPAACEVAAEAKVLAIGSSSMVAPLGPMLKRVLAEDGIALEPVGASATGLARPDFYDWPARATELVAEHAPAAVVVSLGANDFQGIWEVDHWVRRSHAQWEPIYAARIDRMLEILTRGAPERLVLWIGPYAFWGDNALEQGPVVGRLLRERIEAWNEAGGRAVYLDLWAMTTDRRGQPLSRRALPGITARQATIRLDDNIHLTDNAVRSLIVRPVVERLRDALCLPASDPAVR